MNVMKLDNQKLNNVMNSEKQKKTKKKGKNQLKKLNYIYIL